MEKVLNQKSVIARCLAVMAAIAMVFAMSATMQGGAFAANAPRAAVQYDSYNVSTGVDDPNDPVATQYVEVRFTYPSGLTIDTTQVADWAGDIVAMFTPPAGDIFIGGGSIVDRHRPLSASVGDANGGTGNVLVLKIGPNTTDPGPLPTAIYGGILEVVSATGFERALYFTNGDGAADIHLTTLIPGGTKLTQESFGHEGDSPVTVEIATPPSVRGIVNVGIYRLGSDGVSLEPIDPDLNAKIADLPQDSFRNGVNAYIAHFPAFQNATPESVAAEIAYTLTNGESTDGMPAVEILAGYTITASTSDATLTVTSSDPSEVLYLYIMDDNLIKAVNAAQSGADATYDSIVAAGGVLPNAPSAY